METTEQMLERWKQEFPPHIYNEVEYQIKSYVFQLRCKNEEIDRLSAKIKDITKE